MPHREGTLTMHASSMLMYPKTEKKTQVALLQMGTVDRTVQRQWVSLKARLLHENASTQYRKKTTV